MTDNNNGSILCTTDSINKQTIELDCSFCVTCGYYGNRTAFERYFERWREFHLNSEEHELNLEAYRIYERDLHDR